MRFKDITLANVRNFIEGNLKALQRTFLPHEKEQIIYRATACSDCLNAGKCSVCGCATPGLFYAPRKKDSKGKWGPFMDLKDWEGFKKTKEYEKVMGKLSKAPDNLGVVHTTPPRPGSTVVLPSTGIYMEPTTTGSDYSIPGASNLENKPSPTEGDLPNTVN